jgi:hypothetical protein
MAHLNGHAGMLHADVQVVDLGDVPTPVRTPLRINGRQLLAWHLDSAPRSVWWSYQDALDTMRREQARRREADPEASVVGIGQRFFTAALVLLVPGLSVDEAEGLSDEQRTVLLQVLGILPQPTRTEAPTTDG